MRNSICAGNLAAAIPSDVQGPLISGGFNLVGNADGTTGFTATTDQKGTAAAPLGAMLGTLQNNGGHTDTFLPLPGSPALDRGKAFSLATDQRGVGRVYDDPAVPNATESDGSDIGAVERHPLYTGPPVILSLTSLGGGQRILFQGTAGLRYALQMTPDLTTPFAILPTPQGVAAFTDGLGQIAFTAPGPLPAMRFYRVMKVP